MRPRKLLIFCFALLLAGLDGIAQNKAIIDSLLYKLQMTNDNTEKAIIYNSLCWNYRVDSPKLGYEYGLKALDIYTQQQNILRQCNVLNKLGINKRNLGEYSAALDHFFQILNLAKKPECNLEIAYANNNIADIYSRLEKYDKALEFAGKALPLFQSIGNKEGIAYNYNLEGTIYQYQNKWEKALTFFKLSLALRLNISDVAGAASSYINIGDCCLELDQPDSAYYYIQKGIEYYNKAGFANYGRSYISLGKYYTAKNNFPEAIKYLNEAAEKAKIMKSPDNIQKANELLHAIYFKQGEYKKAYEIQNLARKIGDTLRKSDYIRKITTLELNYAFEQQVRQKELEELKNKASYESRLYEQKIILYGLIFTLLIISVITFFIYRNYKYVSKTNRLLKEYNEEISRQKIAIQSQNEQLQELNATKDKFFNIIAHDLKNPFNGILGISDHIITSWSVNSYEETISMVKMIRDSSQNAFNLLENLLEWSRAQTDRIEFKPEYFLLKNLINEVVGLLKDVADQKKISIDCLVDENLRMYADKNMIHTVLRNLVANAIKFTELNGKITVSAEMNNEQVIVSVKDNGVGISKENKAKLFKISEKITSLGTQNEKGTGLGLLLCKEFIDKHNGTIRVETEPGVGSDFIVTVPFQPAT
jgi:signal transduction histidine kinase